MGGRGKPWLRRLRIVAWVLPAALGLLLLLLLLLHLPPVQQWLADLALRRGGEAAGLRITAGSVRWNLLTGRLRIESFSLEPAAESTAAESPTLHFDAFELRISTWRVLAGKFRIRELRLSRPRVRLALDPQGRPLLPGAAGAAAEPPAEETPPEPAAELPDLRIRRIVIEEGSLELRGWSGAESLLTLRGIGLDGSLQLPGLRSEGALRIAGGRMARAGKAAELGALEFRLAPAAGEPGRLRLNLSAEAAGVLLEAGGAATGLPEPETYELSWKLEGRPGKLIELFLEPGQWDPAGVSLAIEGSLRGGLDGLPRGEATARIRGLRTGEVLVSELSLDASLDEQRRVAVRLDARLGGGQVVADAEATLTPEPREMHLTADLEDLDLGALVTAAGAPPSVARSLGALSGRLELTAGELDPAAVQGGATLLLSPPERSLPAAVPREGDSGSRRGDRQTESSRAGPGFAPRVLLEAGMAQGRVTLRELRLEDPALEATIRGWFAPDGGGYGLEGALALHDAGPLAALLGITAAGSLQASLAGEGTLARPGLQLELDARGTEIAGVSIQRCAGTAELDGDQLRLTLSELAAGGLQTRLAVSGTLPPPLGRGPLRLEARTEGLSLEGAALPELHLSVESGAETLVRVRSEPGLLDGELHRGADGALTARAVISSLDLGLLAPFVPDLPADAGGTLSGEVELSLAPGGRPQARIELSELRLHLGGRTLAADGPVGIELQEGRLEVRRLRLQGDEGSSLSLAGNAGLQEGRLNFELQARVPELAAWAAPLGMADLRGALEADLRITGPLERPQPVGRIHVSNLLAGPLVLGALQVQSTLEDDTLTAVLTVEQAAYGDRTIPDARVEARLAGDLLSLEGSLFQGTLLPEARVTFGAAPWAEGRIRFAGFDLAAALRLLGREELERGLLSGEIRFRGPLDDPEAWSLETALDAVSLAGGGLELAQAAPLRLRFAAGVLRVESLLLRGPGAELELQGALPLQPPEERSPAHAMALDLSLDLARLTGLVPELDRLEGTLGAELRLEGALVSPRFRGRIGLEQGALDAPGLPAPLERITAELRFVDPGLRLERLQARFAGGDLEARGLVGLAGLTPESLEFDLRARGLDLSLGEELQLRTGAELKLTGEPARLTVGGRVMVQEALYTREIDFLGLLRSLAAPPAPSAIEPEDESAAPAGELALDLVIDAPENLRVEGPNIELDLGARLQLLGTSAIPGVLGIVTLQGGAIDLFRARFEVEEGSIRFTDPWSLDPELDIRATTTKRGERITLRITGRAGAPNLLLSSEEGKSQVEILKLLLGAGAPGETGDTADLAALARRYAAQELGTVIAEMLGARTDLEIEPFPASAEGERFLFRVGKRLGERLELNYFKGERSEDGDAIEARLRLGGGLTLRARQNQDGSQSAGFRFRKEFH